MRNMPTELKLEVLSYTNTDFIVKIMVNRVTKS